MNKYCKTCEKHISKCTCRHPDIIDEAIALGLGFEIMESIFDSDNSSDLNSDINLSDDSPSPDFGGGEFGGAGGGGDW